MGNVGRELLRGDGATRGASVGEVKRAYKKLSKMYHPDKFEGDEAEATAMFIKIKRAYDALSSPTRNEWYDKYGEEGLAWKENAGVDEGDQAKQQIAIYYIIWTVITYLLTLPSRSYQLEELLLWRAGADTSH